MIFVISALASAQVPKIIHQLNPTDPFDHLETQLIFAAKPKWSSMKKIE
jgi:hypothetical protein